MRRETVGLLIAIGFLFVILSIIQTASQSNTGYGGVILIGLIPIIFGSSPEMAAASIILAIALMVISFLLLRHENGKDHKEQSYPEKEGEKVERTETKGGMIIMIGPVPIIMGSDSRMALLMMLIALTIMLIGIFSFMR